MEYNVLIAEDDEDISKILKLYLESNNFKVVLAKDGIEALELIKNEKIDIALVDIMMPNMDGYELIKKIRETKNFPIIVVSAKTQDSDKILGLNLGADDYIGKPFNPLEIIARINSNLRRFYDLNSNKKNDNESKLIVGELELDLESLKLYKNGKEIIITPNEFKLLQLLMKNPGRVYTKSQICESINGEFYENYENSITVHISHLREKIEDDNRNPKYIKNVHGIGYKIEKQ